MECQTVKKSLADYVVEAVHEEVKKEIDTHLTTCEGCRSELLFLRKTASVIHDFKGAEPPDWLWQKIEGKLFEEKKAWWQVPFFRPAAALAFALLLFILSVYKWQQPVSYHAVTPDVKTVEVTEATFHAEPFVQQYYATEAANPVSQSAYLAVLSEGEK